MGQRIQLARWDAPARSHPRNRHGTNPGYPEATRCQENSPWGPPFTRVTTRVQPSRAWLERRACPDSRLAAAKRPGSHGARAPGPPGVGGEKMRLLAGLALAAAAVRSAAFQCQRWSDDSSWWIWDSNYKGTGRWRWRDPATERFWVEQPDGTAAVTEDDELESWCVPSLPDCSWSLEEACEPFSLGRRGWVVGRLGDASCPAGSSPVADEASCRRAAEAAQGEFRGSSFQGACCWCGGCDPPHFGLYGLGAARSKPVCAQDPCDGFAAAAGCPSHCVERSGACMEFTWDLVLNQGVLGQKPQSLDDHIVFASSAQSTYRQNEHDPTQPLFMDIGSVDSGDYHAGFASAGQHRKFRFHAAWARQADSGLDVVEFEQTSWVTWPQVSGFACVRPADCGPAGSRDGNGATELVGLREVSRRRGGKVEAMSCNDPSRDPRPGVTIGIHAQGRRRSWHGYQGRAFYWNRLFVARTVTCGEFRTVLECPSYCAWYGGACTGVWGLWTVEGSPGCERPDGTSCGQSTDRFPLCVTSRSFSLDNSCIPTTTTSTTTTTMTRTFTWTGKTTTSTLTTVTSTTVTGSTTTTTFSTTTGTASTTVTATTSTASSTRSSVTTTVATSVTTTVTTSVTTTVTRATTTVTPGWTPAPGTPAAPATTTSTAPAPVLGTSAPATTTSTAPPPVPSNSPASSPGSTSPGTPSPGTSASIVTFVMLLEVSPISSAPLLLEGSGAAALEEGVSASLAIRATVRIGIGDGRRLSPGLGGVSLRVELGPGGATELGATAAFLRSREAEAVLRDGIAEALEARGLAITVHSVSLGEVVLRDALAPVDAPSPGRPPRAEGGVSAVAVVLLVLAIACGLGGLVTFAWCRHSTEKVGARPSVTFAEKVRLWRRSLGEIHMSALPRTPAAPAPLRAFVERATGSAAGRLRLWRRSLGEIRMPALPQIPAAPAPLRAIVERTTGSAAGRVRLWRDSIREIRTPDLPRLPAALVPAASAVGARFRSVRARVPGPPEMPPLPRLSGLAERARLWQRSFRKVRVQGAPHDPRPATLAAFSERKIGKESGPAEPDAEPELEPPYESTPRTGGLSLRASGLGLEAGASPTSDSMVRPVRTPSGPSLVVRETQSPGVAPLPRNASRDNRDLLPIEAAEPTSREVIGLKKT